MRRDLESKRAEFAKLYKGRELQRMVEPIDQARQSLDVADRKNDDLFATATRQLFATLQHDGGQQGALGDRRRTGFGLRSGHDSGAKPRQPKQRAAAKA